MNLGDLKRVRRTSTAEWRKLLERLARAPRPRRADRRAGLGGASTPSPGAAYMEARGRQCGGSRCDRGHGRAAALQLPPEVREEMLKGMRAGGPPGYEGFVHDYFERLTRATAEPRSATATPAPRPIRVARGLNAASACSRRPPHATRSRSARPGRRIGVHPSDSSGARSLDARLIYADWLDEQGDAWAEYLRLQCRVADPREMRDVGGRFRLRDRVDGAVRGDAPRPTGWR